MADSEIELKLRLDPGEVSRFRRDAALHRNKRARAVSRSLLAVYFDTPDLALRSRKMALRIRQEGPDRIQTLKTSPTGAGLQRRLEFNAPTSELEPDLALIDDPAVRETLASVIGESGLVPIFTTDIRRTIWLLDLPDGSVELALDIGRIESDGRNVQVCEIELELKGGSPHDLIDFASDIATRHRVHVSDDSKAARGYGLYERARPQARNAMKLQLAADEPAWTALARIMEEGAHQLFANEAVILEGRDIEGVHQARVAIRRLRAALGAFRRIIPDTIRSPLKALRRHQQALGPARDWDVFLTETLQPLAQSDNPPKALKSFMKRVEIARKRAYRQANKALYARRYSALQLDLVRFPYHPEPDVAAGIGTGDIARELLEDRLQVVQQAAGDDPTSLDDVALHALRIDIKEMRYALDFFASIYDDTDIKPWRSASKKLQECLGGLNDVVVHAGLLDALDAPDRPVPKSIRRAIDAQNQIRVDEGRADFAERWAAFKALPAFWRQ